MKKKNTVLLAVSTVLFLNFADSTSAQVETGLWKAWIAKPHPYLIVLRGPISTGKTREAPSTVDISLPSTMEPFGFQSSDIKCSYNSTKGIPRSITCTGESMRALIYPETSDHQANICLMFETWVSQMLTLRPRRCLCQLKRVYGTGTYREQSSAEVHIPSNIQHLYLQISIKLLTLP